MTMLHKPAMPKRILVTGRNFPESARLRLESNGYEVIHEPEYLSESALLTKLEDANGYILGGVEKVSANILDHAPALQVIAFLGVGYDSFVDVASATRRGVAVTNTPGTNTQAVAEMTLALLFVARRRTGYLSSALRRGEWREYLSRNIRGGTLGVVGMGSIGERVARLIRCLGMDILYWSRTRKAQIESDTQAKMVTLEELLSESDVITLHCACTPETRGMIGTPQFSLMKSDAVLINTARPQLVDPHALREALVTARIAAAAFDGYYVEPAPAADNDELGLLKLPEDVFIATPHIAWLTIDSIREMCQLAAEDIMYLLNNSGELLDSYHTLSRTLLIDKACRV
jgi:gluconate 2-dehydrogenase